ncbi:MAG: hypothetical protein ACQETI_04810 [Halobacteriota archaeon]
MEPTERMFKVTELDRREAVTWDVALHAFLSAHVRYDGLLARFANDEGEEFEIALADAWGEEYSKKQYARAMALQRQMAGGERPSGGEAVAAWDSPATAMLTLTASSVPDSDRLSPVEHLDAIHDSFSYNGVRDTLRNTMEYHLGLDADEWGYWLQAEPHGMGGDGGLNACYTHLHVGVYFDSSDLDLESVGSEFERVIDKHVEVCEYASFEAHDYRGIDYLEDSHGCISLNASVENMGSYLAAYMGGYTEDLLDKPIEYLAWGAVYWSAARRRTTRSKIMNAAIAADRCDQRAENPETNQSKAHGETVIWNHGRGLDVVCAYCDSGWGIDQTQLDEPVSDDILHEAIPLDDVVTDELSLSQRWPSADAGVAIGESLAKTEARQLVREYFDHHDPESVTLPTLLGELQINPRHADVVAEAISGEVSTPVESFSRLQFDEWYLDAIIDRDGEEHQPDGGGVDMAPLHLPVEQVLEETRLQHALERGEMFRCSKCRFGTHNHEVMARHLVHEHGLQKPDSADSVLHVESHQQETRSSMRHPASGDSSVSSKSVNSRPRPDKKPVEDAGSVEWECPACGTTKTVTVGRAVCVSKQCSCGEWSVVHRRK